MIELETGPITEIEAHLKQFEEVYSPSEIDTFQRCRRKHHYGYDLRLGEPVPAPAADAGNVMHAAIAELWRTNGDVDQSVAKLKSMYNKLFAWVEPSGFELDRKHKQDHLLRVFLKYGLDVFRNDEMPAISPEHIELGFIISLPGIDPPAMLYGRIDRVVESIRDKSIAPLDIKTTSSWGKDFTARFDPDIQGDMYTYVVRRLMPDRLCRGFYIDGILMQVSKIEFARPLILKQRIDMDEFEAEMVWWINEIRRTKREQFWPKSTNQCTAFGECAFRRICTGHMNPNTINTFPRRPPKGFHFLDS